MRAIWKKYPILSYAAAAILVWSMSLILKQPITLVDWVTFGLVLGIHWKTFYPNDPAAPKEEI